MRVHIRVKTGRHELHRRRLIGVAWQKNKDHNEYNHKLFLKEIVEIHKRVKTGRRKLHRRRLIGVAWQNNKGHNESNTIICFSSKEKENPNKGENRTPRD